ncbi:hypothetical protein [Pseudomonas phage phiH2]|uniref:Uncharacterized protein n=1 Tax=Pseudomonas phage phiH2 TaxID=2981578 RepID=A0A977TP17_9CAUD|nr:hypothetical protein P9A55_gp24 [Pseudomonas phage phiH2]UXX42049.1 hypothetical protein [Pseudomonas phage phiH2]
MARQQIFLIVGGPLDGHAFRPVGVQLGVGQWVELEGEDYAVTRVPASRDNLMVPRSVLVHWSDMGCSDLLWRTFLHTMKAYAAEATR